LTLIIQQNFSGSAPNQNTTQNQKPKQSYLKLMDNLLRLESDTVTYLEKAKETGIYVDKILNHPRGCPDMFNLENQSSCKTVSGTACTDCWNREMPEKEG
jgi:hypothetical protein